MRAVGQCAFCQRTEIEIHTSRGDILFPDAPAITLSTSRMCDDCRTITIHATRVGALALRNELARQRQLDLFEDSKDRIIRLLSSLTGKDAPSEKIDHG